MTSAEFWSNWFPNIACSVVFGVGGWLLGLKSARAAKKALEFQVRILTTLALAAEEQGTLQLARDDKGSITGGRAYVMNAEAGHYQLEGHAPVVNVGPAPG